MDHSRPNSMFARNLDRLDQDALRRVALAIHAMLRNEQDLLRIEEEVRSDLLTFGHGSGTIDDKALLFWRTARIVQTRELVPEAYTSGDGTLTQAVWKVWNLLLQSNVQTTAGRKSLADLAREAEQARIERDARQRRHIGRGHGSSHKADLAGEVAEGVTDGLLSRKSGSSSGSYSSSSGGGGFDLDCCPDGLLSLVSATIKYRRFIR